MRGIAAVVAFVLAFQSAPVHGANALVLIMGIMQFFAGCIMMVTAICGVDYAEDRGFPWFFPICVFGCPAVWLIWTGTGNLLS